MTVYVCYWLTLVDMCSEYIESIECVRATPPDCAFADTDDVGINRELSIKGRALVYEKFEVGP